VRPEDVEVGNAGRADFAGQVVLVSPLGSEQHLNVQVGDVELIVRAPKETPFVIGDQLGLSIDPRRLHLFDATSDQALTASP
jgi:multiple sugar transport system ATP-binding protein